MRLVSLICLVIVMPLYGAEPVKKECSTDPTLRAQALEKRGASGNVTWLSLAVPEKAGGNQFCYERTVWVPQATYIHWPLAGMSRLFVKDTFTIANCCWPGARTERASLEYGTKRQRVDTDVYRGQGEPGPDAWGSASGSLLIDGTTTPVHVVAMADHLLGAGCSQRVTNSGTDVEASFVSSMNRTDELHLKTGSTHAIHSARGEIVFRPYPTINIESRLILLLPSCGER